MADNQVLYQYVAKKSDGSYDDVEIVRFLGVEVDRYVYDYTNGHDEGFNATKVREQGERAIRMLWQMAADHRQGDLTCEP